ncbi:Hypp4629 [Branchiostoma lanceolatum]|uniref:Hypp4629 protein n=1 Tax=Branchiostoma lanceolatum TaxID=7740 RepID=A0A8K0F1M5_BRALA|nr:Hypp4629 [Branchiostoma lanceolatum]
MSRNLGYDSSPERYWLRSSSSSVGQRDDSSSRDGDSMDTESFEIRFDVENDCTGSKSCQGPAAMALSEGNGRIRSKQHLPESKKIKKAITKAEKEKKGRRWSSRSVGEDFRRKLFAGGKELDS